ncbi:hypothetical protein ONS96_010356 [Cadophora gregata f. sp. sojae]|nr:hypothetical protein ONS96_010356 [Cadophora gregata f. sp. sojae]
MIGTDPINTGYALHNDYLASHDPDDKEIHIKYESENSQSIFFDEEQLSPRIFVGDYSASMWHEDVDAIQDWTVNFLANVMETLGELEPRYEGRKYRIHHCEGRDERGQLNLRQDAHLDADVEERTTFRNTRVCVEDYEDNDWD